jgi:hypothetical protein
MEQNKLPILRPPIGATVDPDEWGGWRFRIEIKSETSPNIYVVSQNVKHKYWACSCFGFRRYKKCKHMKAMSLPGGHQPYEVDFKP